jgi:hypothetical protein
MARIFRLSVSLQASLVEVARRKLNYILVSVGHEEEAAETS